MLPKSSIAKKLARPSGRAWETFFSALARKSAGEDIILLSIGDPDFPTPSLVVDALQDSVCKNRTHYGPPAGEMPLRETIAEMESRNTDRRIAPETVSIVPGATGGIFSVISCIGNPGDRIVVPEPAYTSYEMTIAAANMDMVQVPQQGPEFSVDPDSLLEAADGRTAAILVNTPCNPTGHMIPAQVLRYLADETRKKNIWLICDEVYSLLYFETPHISLLRSTSNHENTIVIDSLSKSHAMTGWRVGWTITPEHLAQDLARHTCGINFGVSQFVQDAAEAALRSSSAKTLQMRQEYRRRRDFMVGQLNQLAGIECRAPAAGIFLLVRFDLHGNDVARKLLDEVGVSVFPGSAFGPSSAEYVRLSLTAEDSEIERACGRIANWWTSQGHRGRP